MVHPTALAGKTTHGLADILDAFEFLIARNYNRDAGEGKKAYRSEEDPPLKKIYKGMPFNIPSLPSVAIVINDVEYEDAPQDAGAEVRINFQIVCFAKTIGTEPQQQEAIRMVEAIRHIILDNSTLPTADGTEQVFQAAYLTSSVEFGDLTGILNEDRVGVQVAAYNLQAVVSELGY